MFTCEYCHARAHWRGDVAFSEETLLSDNRVDEVERQRLRYSFQKEDKCNFYCVLFALIFILFYLFINPLLQIIYLNCFPDFIPTTDCRIF